MTNHLLLTGMMAYGRRSSVEQPVDRRDIREYVASARVYGRLRLQPLIIKTEAPLNHGWSLELDQDHCVIASDQGVYEISSTSGDLDQSSILDAIHGMYAVMDHGAPPDIVLIPIKPSDIPKSRTIPIKKAIDIFTSTLPYTSPLYEAEYQAVFREKTSRGYSVDNKLWNLVSAVLGDEQVIYASLFLASAFRDFVFWGDDIEQTILRSEEKPQRITDAVNVENAIHNCYKVIEAIYGGTLAKGWDKVAARLREQGLDPDQKMGYPHHDVFQRESALEKISRLQNARHDRAAHGRIHANRKSTYYELMDFQQVARHLLWRHIVFKYPAVEDALVGSRVIRD